jgi:hypothetical protein
LNTLIKQSVQHDAGGMHFFRAGLISNDGIPATTGVVALRLATTSMLAANLQQRPDKLRVAANLHITAILRSPVFQHGQTYHILDTRIKREMRDLQRETGNAFSRRNSFQKECLHQRNIIAP